MIRLGITGGIGSGKSFVAHCLEDYFGLCVYDTDREAKRLMCEHPGIQSDLRKLLGDEVYCYGELNKPLLIQYLFSDTTHAAQINSIVHPRVKADFRAWCNRKQQEGVKYVAVESAILFESGFDKEVDKVLVVTAPLSVRIARVMQRDGVSRKQVEERISAQLPEETRIQRADMVVINDGIHELQSQLELVLSSLRD